MRQHIRTHAENGQILSIFRMKHEIHQTQQVCSSFVVLRQHICTHAENGQILSIFRMRNGSHHI